MRLPYALVMIVVVASILQPQTGTDVERIELTQIDPNCVCVKLLSDSALAAHESKVSDKFFQIFTDSHSGRELFRITFGRVVDGQELKEWRYGISAAGDFNRDGKTDYAWYGGDDSGYSLYLLLSQGDHYRRMDVMQSLRPVAKHQLPQVNDQDLLSGEFVTEGPWLERSSHGLVLAAKIAPAYQGKERVTIRVPQSQFVYVNQQ